MSEAPGRAWNWLLVTAALTLGHGLVAAAPEAAAGTEGGISGAKRDYEALKAPAENTAERPKIDLPPAPTLELKTESAVPATTTVRGRKLTEQERLRELQREKEASRNWLIEAMAKQEQPAAAVTPAPVASPEPDSAELDRAAKLMALLDAISAKPAGDRSRISAESATDGRKDPPTVLNPLDRYMTAWMTSADFKLLGPKPDTGAAIGGAELFQPGANRTEPRPGQPFAELSAGLDGGRAGPGNPYLREVAPPPANLTDFAPPPAAVPPNPIPALVTPAPRPEPPPPPSFSEQLKAQDDAKYFKQLKRF